MYELSLTEHVMMSSDQRSSLCHPTNQLGKQCYTNSSTQIKSTTSLPRLVIKNLQDDQLNFRRFPVFRGFSGAVLPASGLSIKSQNSCKAVITGVLVLTPFSSINSNICYAVVVLRIEFLGPLYRILSCRRSKANHHPDI